MSKKTNNQEDIKLVQEQTQQRVEEFKAKYRAISEEYGFDFVARIAPQGPVIVIVEKEPKVILDEEKGE